MLYIINDTNCLNNSIFFLRLDLLAKITSEQSNIFNLNFIIVPVCTHYTIPKPLSHFKEVLKHRLTSQYLNLYCYLEQAMEGIEALYNPKIMGFHSQSQNKLLTALNFRMQAKERKPESPCDACPNRDQPVP
jgi:hypothetical protein